MADTTPVDKPAAAEKPVKATKEKKPKAEKVSKEKRPKAAKSAPTHPPYLEMIKDAIISLKEKTGSSPQAIHKFISEKYPGLPGNSDKLMKIQLKNLAASGKLVKVKNSFKLGDDLKKQVKKPVNVSDEKPKPVVEKEAKPAADKTPKKAAAVVKKSTPKKAAAKVTTPKKETPKAKKVAAAPKPKKSTPKKVTTPKKAAPKATKPAAKKAKTK